jgi:hypothetical protein
MLIQEVSGGKDGEDQVFLFHFNTVFSLYVSIFFALHIRVVIRNHRMTSLSTCRG